MQGLQYSLNGFLNAVIRRTSRTVLVEGTTDKTLLQRLASEQNIVNSKLYAVDQVSIVDDPALSGLGNKARVKIVAQAARQLSAQMPKIFEKLATLMDREWDGLLDHNGQIATHWSAPVQEPNGFITIGHSVENYQFVPDCVIGYVRFAHAEHLSPKLEQEIRRNFPRIVALATSFSAECFHRNIISRCNDLVHLQHMQHVDDKLSFANTLVDALTQRQVPDAQSVVDDANKNADIRWADISSLDYGKWLAHGHIGVRILWASIARLAITQGVPAHAGENIALADQRERLRFWQDWLSTIEDTPHRAPLDDVIQWLFRDNALT